LDAGLHSRGDRKPMAGTGRDDGVRRVSRRTHFGTKGSTDDLAAGGRLSITTRRIRLMRVR
jgi:hypothetical protein